MTPSVLHVNDAAFTAANLIAEARRRGQRWDFLPKAAPAQQWRGPVGQVRRAAIGGAWVARLAVAARRHDIVHVHSASTLAHSRLGARRYLVHCHGTDVRTAQYQPAWRASVRAGLRDAEAVFYSTPDLAEHVLGHRADAVYLPVPIDVDEVARWAPPRDGRPSVFFASRWSPDKGVATQLELARALVAELGRDVDVLGLDWGPRAADAAAAGVRLVPAGDHAAFLDRLTGAGVVLGQAAGILAASELEALAAGAPLVVPAPLPLYDDAKPPVHGGDVDSGVSAVRELLAGTRAHDPEAVRAWTRETHGVGSAVDIVSEVYARVLAARR